jgi:riboflavin kinase/FMN adenylyltransferase
MAKRIYALGFFDGVHRGHQALLLACCRLAAKKNCETAAITFENHPQSLFLDNPPPLINTVSDRKRLLRHFGITHVEQLPVTKEVMSTNWRDFLHNLLDHGAAGFVCGDDFRFGNRGEGDAQKLRKFCDELGLPCIIVPEQTVEGVRVSSTHIRNLLEQGDVEQATAFLGHPHILTGEVVAGRSLGRTLGTPTANLRIPDGVICPRYGVYACRALVDGQSFAAVTNIGTRPTVSGTHVTVEPWLLDFNGDLYSKELTLQFYKFLRPERKFDSLEELRAEIQKNAAQTRGFFSNEGENAKKL